MDDFFIQINEFIFSRTTSVILVVTFLLAMFIIWGKLSGKFIKKILFGALLGFIVSAICLFIFKMPLDKIGIIGIVTFSLGVIFKKVQVP